MTSADEWSEVIGADAFDEHIPKSLLVRGSDGSIIRGAVAEAVKDAAGVAVSVILPCAQKVTGHIPRRRRPAGGPVTTLTVTHTRTHIVITPANPFLACAVCGKRAEAFHDDRCGCGETRPMNMPCGHVGGYDDLCPSWNPVDGCQCHAHPGYVPHPAVPPRA